MKPSPLDKFADKYSDLLNEVTVGEVANPTLAALSISIFVDIKTYGQLDLERRGLSSLTSLQEVKVFRSELEPERYNNELDIDDRTRRANMLFAASLWAPRRGLKKRGIGLEELINSLELLDDYMRGRCSIGTALMLNDMAVAYGTTTSEGFKEAYDMHRADLRLRVINHHSRKDAVELLDSAIEDLDLSRFVSHFEQEGK